MSEPAEKCDVQYETHPTMPHLVAICVRPSGHDGEHSNVLPKTLASLLLAAATDTGQEEQ